MFAKFFQSLTHHPKNIGFDGHSINNYANIIKSYFSKNQILYFANKNVLSKIRFRNVLLDFPTKFFFCKIHIVIIFF